MVKWSNEATMLFVKLYLKNDCLWNPEDPHYRNRGNRFEALAMMASEFEAATGLEMDSVEVRQKIKVLRSTYSQEVHKVINRSIEGSKYIPSLPWFKMMDAKLKNIALAKERVHVTSTDIKDDHSSEEDNCESLDACAEAEESSEHRENVKREQRSSYSPPLQLYRTKTAKTGRLKRKRRRTREESPETYEVVEETPPEIQYAEAETVEDEFDIYGRFVASQLRRMELTKALRLQMQINAMMSDARLAAAGDAPNYP